VQRFFREKFLQQGNRPPRSIRKAQRLSLVITIDFVPALDESVPGSDRKRTTGKKPACEVLRDETHCGRRA